MGNVEFKHYDNLVEYFDGRVTGDPEEYIATVLGFGRLAGVVTEKYHSFLKPPLKVYYCPSCHSLSRTDICQECGNRIEELRFCETCNHPYLVREAEAEESGSESSGEKADLVPFGEAAPVERCPGCNDRVGVSDVEVPTSTLLSFMLSEMCRVAPSEKVLVFSDSHSSAESVAKQIQQTEYNLMAATLYIDFLKQRGGTGGQLQAYRHVVKQLRDEYWKPFFDQSLSASGSAYNMIEQLQDDVVKNADLYNCGFLFDSTLVTSDVLYESADDAFELLVGHTLWEVFASSESVSFTKSGITISALPREKIHQKVRNKLSYCNREISGIIDGFLFEFLDAGIIHEKDYESLQLEIEDGADSEEDQQAAIDYLNAQRKEIASSDALPERTSIQSGVFVRRHNQDRTDLRLLTHVAFCANCQTAFPALEDEGPGETCFKCGADLETFRRYDVNNGEYGGPGYADIDDASPWALDHWAHDITRPLRSDEIDFVTVGIHKGNIPATVAGLSRKGSERTTRT
jgi:rRNA maturation endonuclease Nob1